jgi:hypothetical protein
MADITISGLDAAVPPAGAVIPFSDGTTTNKVDINSIVGLTTNGTFRGTLQRGSYGSLSVAGSTNTWAGIDFTDASATLMVRTSDQYSGIFKTNNAWIWAFDGSGNLVTGAIPWANITGKPTIPTNTGIGGAILFTSSTTWTVPTGVTKIKVYCIGAGGRAGYGNGGSAGGSSYITGIDIVGGGGGGAISSGSLGAGGVGSGALCVSTNTGSAGKAGTNGGGTQSAQIFGKIAGTGGACNNGGGGGAGGYAFGVATVTPGATLTINVGTPGSYSDCNNVSPLAGLVGIEW